jgi:hypothetical protein
MTYFTLSIVDSISQLKTSDIISLGSVVISALSLAGAFITYVIKTVTDYNKKIEEIRPNVFISYERKRNFTLLQESLVLKNYGLTAAWIKKIEINPPFENNGKMDFKANNFKNIKDFPLAPGQEIRGIISLLGLEDNTLKKTKRSYYIEYKAEGYKKVYKTKYIIDEEGYPFLVRTDDSQATMKINKSLVDLKQSVDKIKKSIDKNLS